MKMNPLVAGLFAVPIAFIVVISFGNWIHTRGTTLSDTTFGFIAVLGLVVIASSIQWALMGFPLPRWRPVSPSQRERSRIAYQTFAEWKAARRAELESSPAKQRYLPFFDRNDFWSDEQMEYNDDRTILATCVHLRGIEEAMRDAGISMRRLTGPLYRQEAEPNVQASCQLDLPKVKAYFKPPSWVQFTTGSTRDRGDNDNLWAHLTCQKCNSRIEVEYPGGQAQIFPS